MGGPVRILVASWGNPAEWKTVTYEIQDSGGRIKSTRGISTLALLRDHLSEQEGGLRKILIFVQDSAIPYLMAQNESEPTYENIENSVKKYYEEVLKTQILPDKRRDIDLNFIVAPAVGSFEPRSRISLGGRRVRLVEFRGRSLGDYYALVTKKLADHVVKVLEDLFRSSEINIPNSPKIEFHVDLSHGINYAPALLLTAVEDIAGVLRATLGQVEVHAYNSEPVRASKTSSGYRVRIHLTKLPVTPIFRIRLFDDLEGLHSPAKNLLSNYPTSSKGNLDLELGLEIPSQELFTDQLLSGAVAAGCPLLILDLVAELLNTDRSIVEQWLNWVESLYNLNQEVKVRSEAGGAVSLTVSSRFQLSPAVVRLAQLFILEQSLFGDQLIRRASDNLRMGDLVSLEEIERVVMNSAVFLERPSLRERALAETERVANKVLRRKPIPCSRPILLADLEDGRGPPQDPLRRRRNILAHSCLEKNVIEVCREGERDVKNVRLRIKKDDGAIYEVYRAALTELGYEISQGLLQDD